MVLIVHFIKGATARTHTAEELTAAKGAKSSANKTSAGYKRSGFTGMDVRGQTVLDGGCSQPVQLRFATSSSKVGARPLPVQQQKPAAEWRVKTKMARRQIAGKHPFKIIDR
jgi:hypothetical protein